MNQRQNCGSDMMILSGVFLYCENLLITLQHPSENQNAFNPSVLMGFGTAVHQLVGFYEKCDCLLSYG